MIPIAVIVVLEMLVYLWGILRVMTDDALVERCICSLRKGVVHIQIIQ